jgi:hypothetical protein
MRWLTAWVLVALCACSKRDGDEEHDSKAAAARTSSAASVTRTQASPWPDDPCSWVAGSDVEAIVGKLAGPPRAHEGGCLYPLAPPPPSAEDLRRQEAARKLQELAKKFGASDLPEDRRPTEPAVILNVDLSRDVSEQAAVAGESIAASWAGLELKPDSVLKGWDDSSSPIVIGMPGFIGRTGELTVMVTMQAIAIDEEKAAALAARARDRVPDRAFGPRERDGMTGTPPSPDPCVLLTPAEAAQVLGPLTVPPYRTREDSPFLDPNGKTCAYYTAGHRVLSLTPQWSYGQSTMEAVRVVGGLAGRVLPGGDPEAADTIEGPWDEVASMPMSSSLAFLKGDRSLEVSFGTSSTDIAGALRLAQIAVGRLATARAR